MTDYTYNTGNPIGSTDVRDGVDNLKSFDVLLNSTDDEYQDRLGNTVPTAAGAMKKIGFKPASFTFVTGGTLGVTDANKCIYNPAPAGDNNWYSWGGTLPHTVAPGTDPTVVGSGYVPRTDVTLRNELDNSYPISFGYDANVESTRDYITYLNSNPKFSYGNVALGGGVDTRIPLSESGDFSMLSINGIKLQSAFVGGKPLKLPAAFPWNPGITAFSEAYGKVSLPFFDIAKYDFTVSSNTAFTTLYVDPVNGSNFQQIPNDTLPNSGTDPLYPLKSVNTAFDRITSNSYAFAAILLTGGYYYDINSWAARYPSSNIVVKRWKRNDYRDTDRIVLSSETKLTWGVYSGSTYSSTKSGVSWVLDSTNFNEYGDWLVYEKAASLELCQSTPGTWFQSDSTVYVHRINGGVVNSEIHVLATKGNGGCSGGDYTLYIDDIDFFGGSTGFEANSRTEGTSEKIYLNKCRFFYSAGNGFENYGINTCITKDCVAAYTVRDGFNYHSNRNYLTKMCKSLEINNRTYMTGRGDSFSVGTSNGSTCHDANIVIRLGCSYERSIGPVVADIDSCKTYNFCVSARESIRAESSPRTSSFLAAGDGCVQYLNNCQAVRSEWSLDVYSSAKMYVEDIFIDSSIEGIENISVMPT